ncbi:unnamed protein product [Calypogeia fissa]
MESAEATTTGYLLHFASKGDVDAIQKLLDEPPGVSVDSQDYDGRTAMHLAASEGHLAVIEFLLRHNANVNPVDRWRKTPLADARRYEAKNAKEARTRKIYHDVCNLLVSYGGSTSSPFEIDPTELNFRKEIIRECNFGEIRLANWRGTNVEARIMNRSVEKSSPKSNPKLTKQLSLLQRLRHPNIVQFLGAVQTKSEPLVLVTENLPKGNLFELLRESKKRRLPQKEAMNYALDIARGMNYLHQHKPQVVHCDLNPMNLLRDAGGHLKVAGLHLSEIERICQFGKVDASEKVEQRDKEMDHSRNMRFFIYRAPELGVTRPSEANPKVDVYSFGVIVREMFEGLASGAQKRGASRHMRSPRVEAQEAAASRLYPPGLEELLDRCCHRNPEKRPTFKEMIGPLETIHAAMSKKPFCGAVQNMVSNLAVKWHCCFTTASSLKGHRSKSTVHSVESQKGDKQGPNGAADHTTCTPIPE